MCGVVSVVLWKSVVFVLIRLFNDTKDDYVKNVCGEYSRFQVCFIDRVIMNAVVKFISVSSQLVVFSGRWLRGKCRQVC